MEKYTPNDITKACLDSYAHACGYKQGFYDAPTAAKVLGVTRPRVTQLVNEGCFNAVVCGLALFIPIDEVERYNANKRWAELTDMEGC